MSHPLLDVHPAPWRPGEQHEAMCVIEDATGKAALSVRTWIGGCRPWEVAEAICEIVNQQEVFREALEKIAAQQVDKPRSFDDSDPNIDDQFRNGKEWGGWMMGRIARIALAEAAS